MLTQNIDLSYAEEKRANLEDGAKFDGVAGVLMEACYCLDSQNQTDLALQLGVSESQLKACFEVLKAVRALRT